MSRTARAWQDDPELADDGPAWSAEDIEEWEASQHAAESAAWAAMCEAADARRVSRLVESVVDAACDGAGSGEFPW